MRCHGISWLLILSTLLVGTQAFGGTWIDLLGRADSLTTTGELDSAGVVLDHAMSQALTEYAKSDSTVEIWIAEEGTPRNYYFRSYADAETLYTRAVRIREGILGGDHPEVALTLLELGVVYSWQRKHSEMKPLCERALRISKEALGPRHPDVGRCLDGLARAHLWLGENELAESLFTESLSILEASLGPEHFYVGQVSGGLATLCWRLERYSECEVFYKRAVAILEKACGSEYPGVSGAMHNLGLVYMLQGRLTDAELLLTQSLKAGQKAMGPDHAFIAQDLNSLATVYNIQGRFAAAEPLLKRAVAIWEKNLGAEHHYVAVSLSNLAVLYMDYGKYEEAERLQERALAIMEKAMGPEHRYVASRLNNLARLYQVQGRYEEAEPLLERALAISEKVRGPDHPDVASSLNSLATLYQAQGRYAEAASLLEQALAIHEKARGPEDHGITAILVGLADLYCVRGRYQEAELLLERALGTGERTFGQDGYYLAGTLESMCKLRRLQDAGGQATDLAERAARIRHKNFGENAPVLSEKDALTYSQFLRNSVGNYITCYFELGSPASDVARRVADVLSATKGQVSDEVFERQRAVVEESDSTTLELAESLRYTKFRLSRLFVEGPGEDLENYRNQVDSLGRLAEELESELSRHSASFREQQDYRKISTERIASLLPKNSVLVEYVKYDYRELEPEGLVPSYMVLVISQDADPVLLDLGEASAIEALVGRLRDHMLRVSSSNMPPTAVDKHDYVRMSDAIYAKVWRPIKPHVDQADMVLIAPDGALNTISFASLTDGEGAYLAERIVIHYLSSGRDLIRLERETEPGLGLLALGDPDYDAPAPPRLKAAPPPEDMTRVVSFAMRNIRSDCAELNNMNVTALPGTRSEIEEIARRWKESTNEPLTVHFDREASEERFKAEAPGKRVIHLATHGYFLGSACRAKAPQTGPGSDMAHVGENPLLLSGLLFAGANLHGAGVDSLGLEDGILTAYEVSALDLDGADLVVLSACETGLGEVAEGEGVYGLRRAFQMAGARTVISALWPVSDEATAQMMAGLYERGQESLAETMRRVQLERLEYLRSQGMVDHPFSWAAFVAIGDWK